MLSIIVPAYNEEDAISETISNINRILTDRKISFELLIVDDGSTDSTLEMAKKSEVAKVIKHPINKGYGAALKTGILNARGDWILIIDADGTYPVETIPTLYEYCKDYDMVVGARNGKDVHIPLIRRPGKFILSKMANYLTGVKIPDLNSGFRIFKKEIALKFFNILPLGFSFTTTITIACLSYGYSVKYVSTDYKERTGTSKINIFQDGLKFISLIISTIIYFNPLKVFLPVGSILFLTGLIYSLLKIFIIGEGSSIGIIITISGVQIIFMGFLADLINKRMGY